MADDLSKRVEQFIMVRDTLEQLAKEAAEKAKPWLAIKQELEGIINARLDENNVDSMKTKYGTATRATKYSATVQDAEQFMNFVKEGNWDIIERRANQTAVKAYMVEHKAEVPGVKLNSIASLSVTRPRSKKQVDPNAAVTTHPVE